MGITNADLNRIPIGLMENKGGILDPDYDGLPTSVEIRIGTDPYKADTDGDGYTDGLEVSHGYPALGFGIRNIDMTLAESLAGRLLLQVEAEGEVWYVNPGENRRYLISSEADAYVIGPQLALGISNADLDLIEIEPIPSGIDHTQVALFTEVSQLFYDLDEEIEYAASGISYGGEPVKAMVIFWFGIEESNETYTLDIAVGELDAVSFENRSHSEFYRDYSGTLQRNVSAHGIAIQVETCEKIEFRFGKDCEDITQDDILNEKDFFLRNKGQGWHVKLADISEEDWTEAYWRTHPSGRMDWLFDKVQGK
jgi:hypothetical protein